MKFVDQFQPIMYACASEILSSFKSMFSDDVWTPFQMVLSIGTKGVNVDWLLQGLIGQLRRRWKRIL
jgi:hypothetical protein